MSCKEMEGLLKDAGRAVQTSLTGQHKAFDGEFYITKRMIRGIN